MAKKKVKIEFIDKGFKEILKQPSVATLVDDVGMDIEMRANASSQYGDVYAHEVVIGYNGSRWVGFVHNSDYKGAVDEAENKTLSKAVK